MCGGNAAYRSSRYLRLFVRGLAQHVTGVGEIIGAFVWREGDRSSGSISPRFSRQRRSRAASSSPMMIRASEPPMK
jgi:hypothetical protein